MEHRNEQDAQGARRARRPARPRRDAREGRRRRRDDGHRAASLARTSTTPPRRRSSRSSARHAAPAGDAQWLRHQLGRRSRSTTSTIEQLRRSSWRSRRARKVVAVTHIDLRRDFRDKTKLDVNLEVSTYSKETAGEGRRQRRRGLRRQEGQLSDGAVEAPVSPTSVRARARSLRYVGLVLLALIVFVFALQLSFPYDRVKDKLVEALADKYDVTIGEVERGIMPGPRLLQAVIDPHAPDQARRCPSPRSTSSELEVDVGSCSLLSAARSASTSTRRSAPARSRRASRSPKFGHGDIERQHLAGRRAPRRRACRCARCSACR